ncbi:DNA ligase D [Vineibacter terrae]|uniref:DNA ligase D n=1 Tax=Vineibacter terrae TaxID=2586908 RepID=UPI002E37642A|nr:DNA ligase D [Vineibacter terrae]HEX2889438.1 DNA ligase D [Vineibacter terrae]
MNKPLDAYRAKRDFSRTPEPDGQGRAAPAGNAYVIQKHAARRLHYDFRLELDGVLKSWAVPEGPSLVPDVKRLAVHVEDHPLEYGGFEGVIPQGAYGAGTVMVWDRGTWTPEFDADFGYRKGHLKFRLDGQKLKGVWHLVRMARKPREKQDAWLLIKSKDEAARAADAPDVLTEMPRSALTGRDIDAIARARDRVWTSGQGEIAAPAQPAQPRKPVVKPAAIAKAKKAALPDWVEPCLPSPAEKAPSGAGWVHEIKYDGYRVQARIENGKVALLTRQGLDWTERFPGIGPALAGLPVKNALIDGEVVVQTEAGVASFTALVEALKSGSGNFVFYGFDLLHLDGYDLREATLVARKAALAKIIAAGADNGRVRLSEHIEGDGGTIFTHASRLGLEGIVSKTASAPYRSGRVKTWLKVKTTQSGPFVVAGFIPSSVDDRSVGALVLGEHVGGKLVPSGHVGSGFSASNAHALWQALNPLRTKTAPLKDETATAKGVKWVEPRVVVEIEYRSRTASGLIRHAVFRERVDNKNAADVARDAAAAPVAAKRRREAVPLVRLTNPGRLLWPEQGITKQGLADFYTEIADWILPHVAGRPLSLLRCPGGIAEQCFFQKHPWAGLEGAVRQVKVPDDDEPMLAVDDLAGLLQLVQASVLEIHPWGSTAERPLLPDRITFDLDPGDGVPWQRVIEAAFDVRHRLQKHDLQSFVKTTGGKGLHVVLPLQPGPDWDTVKHFAQMTAESMAAERPDRYVANMAKRVRQGRIYIDYVRNGMGATAVGAYSTRARAGAAVSTPLSWDEIGPGIRSNHFTVANLPKRLAYLERDPWDGFLSLQQHLPSAGTHADTAVPSKDDLAAYWTSVAGAALAHLGRRPLVLVRHENGETFYHQGRPLPPIPPGVHQLPITKRDGAESVRLWVDSVEGLLGLVEMNVIEIHPWGATIDHIERPDMLVLGLDPGDGVEWAFVIETALRMRALLRDEELDSWPKLTGGKGVHIMAPIEPDLDWDELRRYGQSLAERLAATAPQRYVTVAARDRRHGRLYLDWQPNGRGRTAVGAYSPRARPGFPVAAPITWAELERGMRADAYTIFRPPPRPKTR